MSDAPRHSLPAWSRPLALAAVVAAAVPALAACESSQTKSARLQSQAAVAAPAEQGLQIAKASSTLKAGEVTTLTGELGAAVIVEVKNTGSDAFKVPILTTLTGADGGELFTNATPGLQPSLTHLAFVAGGESAVWVNDQIPVTGQTELKAEVTIGDGGPAPTTPQVTFVATTPKLEEDPISGVAATGYVKHDGDTEQQRVLVNVIGRKGDQVVSAGRAIVERVKPGKRARFTAFLIGDPQGAELTATAFPSLEEGGALAPEATGTP